MKCKKGTGADRFVFVMFWVFVFGIFVLMTQCIKPTIAGKSEADIKLSFDEHTDQVLLVALLNYKLDHRPLRELLSVPQITKQNRVERGKEVQEVVVKALREQTSFTKFRLYVDDKKLTEECSGACFPTRKEHSFEFFLPQRDATVLAYRLELYGDE